jgi:hypothetical protein
MKRRKNSWIVLLSLAFLLSACNNEKENVSNKEAEATTQPLQVTQEPVQQEPQPQQTNEADNKQEGFLLVGSDGVMFLRWTELDKQFVGQIQTLFVDNGKTVKIESNNRSFKGIQNGSSISITFDDGNVLTGTLKGNELSLVFPDSEGNLNSMVFKPSTVADYNSAVAKLRGEVQEYNAKEQELKAKAQAIYDQQEAVMNANKTLNSGLSKLESLTKELTDDTKFEDVLKEYRIHWNQMQEHQQNMKALATKKPFDSYQLSEVKYALTEVEYDLTSIEYDNTSMEYKVNEVTGDISAINKQIPIVQQAWATLQSAVKANTTGSPTAQFNSDDVTQAIAQAQKQSEASTSSMQKAQQQAKDYNDKANKLIEDSKKYVAGLKATD